jgi:hypothetical protein
MKNESTQNRLTLQAMVKRISVNSLPAAAEKHSFIINDIPSDIQVSADEHMVASVFGSLLNTIISHTENCCIRISANLFGKEVLINLKESYQVNVRAFAGSLREIKQLAEKIGGTVTITSDRTRETSIFFSFANNLSIAA